MSKELIPHVGFDKVRFGMTEEQVVKLLGKPTERTVSNMGEDPDDNYIDLDYDALGLSLSFDGVMDFRLSDIMTDGATDYALLGRISVGMTFEETMSLATKLDLGPREEVDLDDDLEDEPNDENLVAYDLTELDAALWFKDGVLDTIQIVPPFDEHNNVLWPKE